MKKKILVSIMLAACISFIGCNKVETQPNNQNNQNNQNSANTKITIEQAQDIALEHARLSKDQVTFTKADSQIDDGVDKYDIEFIHENKKYDYEINATDGNIIGFERDTVPYQATTGQNKSTTQNNKATQNNNKITVEKAQEIALKHAQLTKDQVIFDRSEMDIENGTTVYEIEFRYDNIEYDYKIDATTGNVISLNKD